MPFDIQNAITLFISAAAFGVSSLGYFQKRADTQQTLRKRLTDVLKQIVELNEQEAEMKVPEKRKGIPNNYGGFLGDQLRFFVRDAASLSDKLGPLVSPHEKILIAMTFDSMDYVEEAEIFFKSAVTATVPGIERGLAMRNYSRFLNKEGSVGLGKGWMEKAVKEFEGEDDRHTYYRLTTYGQWADGVLSEWDDASQWRKFYELALEEANKLKNPRRKMKEVTRIQDVMNNLEALRESLKENKKN